MGRSRITYFVRVDFYVGGLSFRLGQERVRATYKPLAKLGPTSVPDYWDPGSRRVYAFCKRISDFALYSFMGCDFCGNLVFLIAILGFSTKVADSIISLPCIKEKGLDATLTRIVCRLGGLVVATEVFLEGGQYLGFPLTTLLASAGIGGLAIALSAQGMIKGLLGTITILLDKPFRVGKRIVVRGHDGFVEEIGLLLAKN